MDLIVLETEEQRAVEIRHELINPVEIDQDLLGCSVLVEPMNVISADRFVDLVFLSDAGLFQFVAEFLQRQDIPHFILAHRLICNRVSLRGQIISDTIENGFHAPVYIVFCIYLIMKVFIHTLLSRGGISAAAVAAIMLAGCSKPKEQIVLRDI